MMRKVTMAALIILLYQMGAIAQQPTIELWPNSVPGAVKAKQALVKDTNSENGMLRIIEVTNPTLEVYKPLSDGNGMGIIVCPGGGYAMLAYHKEGTDIAQWLAKQGFTAFVLAYRVPQQREGALQDIQRAIRIVRSEYKMDQVGVIGFSAGGSLSARAATRHNETTYPKVDAADKLSCRPNFAMLIYPAYLDNGVNRTLTPELTVNEQTPPMFIFGTSDDRHSNSSLVMAQALRDNKIPVELHLMPVGGHGYGMHNGAGLQWPPLAETWLKGAINRP